MERFTNRLAGEQSPYLLQHAHNPVDWRPWGDDAFGEAARQDKPVLLSIGYATCHWCHVMERESFENEEIARLLNDAFVCVKVDREERPDIDSIYMSVCQMATGSGGWPLTILLTPGRKPFFAATYLPAESRFGRIGLVDLVPRIVDAWKNRRAELLASAEQIVQALHRQAETESVGAPDETLPQAGYDELMKQYDVTHGGFGYAPKFPTPHRLVFLLRHGRPEGHRAAEHTLNAMRMGGIFDQIGFGFHRYSTDRQWLVPHFEKMLYDQALLAYAYAEAHEWTGERFFADVAGEIIAYVLRDMAAPEGGFYSAEDADSEGEEGRFYLWSAAEAKAVLGEDYAFAARVWNLAEQGNYRDEATGRMGGGNIPHLAAWLDTADAERLDVLRQRLFEVREQRVHPLKDTKILADWNGLMIAALAKTARVLGDDECLRVAIRAFDFIEANMRQGKSRLWHRWREGHAAVDGLLDDYAFLIHGLLELYETTLDPRFLRRALDYNETLDADFLDPSGGGYFMAGNSAEPLIVRPKEFNDGALPSGNSVQMLNLLRLARLTGRSELERLADSVAKAFGGALTGAPSAFSQALVALQFARSEPLEVVVVGDRNDAGTRAMLDIVRNVHRVGKTILLKEPSSKEPLESIAPFTKEMEMLKGRPTAHVCRNFACERPVDSPSGLQSLLE